MTVTSPLNLLRRDCVVKIEAANIGFKQVRKHVGRYSIDDLKKLHSVSPACAVGFAGFGKSRKQASGQWRVDAAMAAVIVTRAATSDDADEPGVELATKLLTVISDWRPMLAVPLTSLAQDVRAEAIDDSVLDDAKIIVWAVLWNVEVTLGTDLVGAGISEQTLGSITGPGGGLTTINPPEAA